MATDKTLFPSDAADKFMMRLPDGMRDLLAEAAKRAGRSMNAEIVARVRATFDRDQFAEFAGLVAGHRARQDDWEPGYAETEEGEMDRRRTALDIKAKIEEVLEASPPVERLHEEIADGKEARTQAAMLAEIYYLLERQKQQSAKPEIPFEMIEEQQRQRDLLLHTQSMFGLLQGKLRQAGLSMSADETQELHELLKAIHAELDKPEPVEEMLDRLEGLTAEVEQIQKMLDAFGLKSPDANLPASARRELEAMRERWAQSQANLKGRRERPVFAATSDVAERSAPVESKRVRRAFLADAASAAGEATSTLAAQRRRSLLDEQPSPSAPADTPRRRVKLTPKS